MSHDDSDRPRRGRLWRYSLRTLLVLVTLVASTIAFRGSQVARQRRAVDAIVRTPGMVVYFDEGWGPIRGYGRVSYDDSAHGLVREFFGLRWPGEVYLSGSDVTDEVLREVVLPVRTLGVVGLTETSVTLDGLAELSSLPDLRIVTRYSDARNQKITGTLTETTQMEFQDTPLEACVEYLADLHGIPIEIDKSVVPDEQWDSNSQFTATVKNHTLGNALDTLLAPNQLGWVVREGKLIITTREVQEKRRAVVKQMSAKMPQAKTLIID